MFTIDILAMIKMLLTYWYTSSFDGEVLRKLNMYFTQFIALSRSEENDKLKDEGNYLSVSPGNMAKLLNSK